MPYIQQPGWLESAVGQGIDAFQRFRQLKDQETEAQRREDERKREDDFRRAQMIEGLGASGQVDADTVRKALASYLPPGTTIAETPAQARNRILAMPEKTQMIPKLAPAPMFGTGPGPSAKLGETTAQPGRETISDENLRFAGLETSDQQREARLKRLITETQIGALGGQYSPNEAVARLTNVPTELGAQFERIKQYQPVLDAAASNFIAGAIGKHGGRINPTAMPQVSQEAYNEFVKSSKINVPPELDSIGRSYFDKALREEYLKQLELDNQREMARARFANNSDDMYRALDNAVRTQAEIVNHMISGTNGMILQHFAGGDPKLIPQDMMEQVTKFRTANDQLQQQIMLRNTFGAHLGLQPVTREQLLGQGGQTINPAANTLPPPKGGAPTSDEATLRAQAAAAMAKTKDPKRIQQMKDEFKRLTGKDY